MEVAIGEGRNSFNMEKGLAWRDHEDEGFGSEAFEAITGHAHSHNSLDMLDNQDVTSHLSV